MEYGFSILVFCFSGALLLYAGLLAVTKDVTLIPRHRKAKIKNRRAYALQFAKIMALVAAAPLLGGLAGLAHLALGVAVLIGSLVLFLWIATKWIKKAQ